MIPLTTAAEIHARIAAADDRYGPFASTHEALGVALEEWDELRDAVRANDLQAVRSEALDLAAALIRMADGLGDQQMAHRSVRVEDAVAAERERIAKLVEGYKATKGLSGWDAWPQQVALVIRASGGTDDQRHRSGE